MFVTKKVHNTGASPLGSGATAPAFHDNSTQPNINSQTSWFRNPLSILLTITILVGAMNSNLGMLSYPLQ